MPKRKIIIIDDNPDHRFIVKEFLKGLGCDVLGEGESGFEAIELLQRFSPDVILMDIKMPGMDGIEAVTAINQLKPVPVIAFTGRHDAETIKKIADAGFMAYLVKPVREDELLPAIELAIARFNEFQILNKENLNLKETIAARKVIERAKGLLMKREGLSERDAFSRIQKMSMDRRRPMKEIAEVLIAALEGKS